METNVVVFLFTLETIMLKPFLVRLGNNTPPEEQVEPFLIWSRSENAAKVNAENYLISRRHRWWPQACVQPMTAEQAEEFIGDDVKRYVILPS